jgi:hypothetical protein
MRAQKGRITGVVSWVFTLGVLGFGVFTSVSLSQSSGCSSSYFSFYPSVAPWISYRGGDGFFSWFKDVNGACPSRADADVPWISVLNPTSPTSSGQSGYTVAPNPNADPREGFIVVRSTGLGAFSDLSYFKIHQRGRVGSSVSGRVVNSVGTPLSGVSLFLDGPDPHGAFTGPDGTFFLDEVVSGNYTLTAFKQTCTFTPASIPFTPLAGHPNEQNFVANCTGVTAGTSSPLVGSGTATQTFTATYRHSGGANRLYLGYLLFLPTPNVVQYTATGSCLVEYNRISNGVRLIDDAGTGWLGPPEGVRAGIPMAPLANSFCTVNIEGVFASLQGDEMTVHFPVALKPALGPVLGTFLQGFDVQGNYSGMTQKGNWVIPGAPQTRTGPAVSGISPNFFTGQNATITMTATNTAGASALSMVHLLVGDAITDPFPCQAIYFPAANRLNLIDAAGTALVSPTGVIPGSPGVLDNGRCRINTALASASVSGVTASVTMPMQFSMFGQKTLYVNAFDNAGKLSHWVTAGTAFIH